MKKLLACVVTLSLAVPVWALVVAAAPLPQRVAGADAIFIGRVIGFEDQDVQVEPFPNAKQTVPYRIATVAVVEGIRGAKKETTIRVGFPAPPMGNPGGGIIVSSGGGRGQLKAGQDGMFMLNQHSSGKFYQTPIFYNFISRETKNFDQEVSKVKDAVKILENPRPALESKNDADRLMAAAMLMHKYRTPVGKSQKMTPIDAEESKLILNAIAKGPWGEQRRVDELTGMTLFYQLRLTAQDGWTQPKVPNQVQQQAQAWLAKNKDTYRIKKYVAE